MPQVTIRCFRDIGPQYLKPLVKTLRADVARALWGTTLEDVDLIVLSSGPHDESAYDLVITIEAGTRADDHHSDIEERVKHVLHRAEEILRQYEYPQLTSLKIRVDLKLGFVVSASKGS